MRSNAMKILVCTGIITFTIHQQANHLSVFGESALLGDWNSGAG
ncbi:hypothetical protein Pr1d_40150 [Bythopirellula goksoeyrii]|uniref:Uncharacterized protein n=1 Tax=Bythopirellula goksoeyrii TaxID=1400387 RepID=A0A5B9QFK4_9BACT|nr:hypothetical protein Pr1d_40150 [Bythopirellula goksoeyrii]